MMNADRCLKNTLAAIGLALLGSNLFAGELVVSQALSLVPPGWSVVQSVEGVLKANGQKDWVAVIEKADKDAGKVRYLIAAFQQQDSRFSRAFVAPGVVMCSTCGGVGKPDPFDSLEMDRRSIVIKQSSGSRERWSSELRFRFDDGKFSLIGKKETSEDQYTDSLVKREINISTGIGVVATRDANGKEKSLACKLPAKYQRNKIEDFDYETDEALADCIAVEK